MTAKISIENFVDLFAFIHERTKLIINHNFFNMSAFDTNEELKTALDEVKEEPSYEVLAEQVLQELEEYVPEDPDMFLDTSDLNRAETKEEQEAWRQQWFENVKQELESDFGLVLVPKNNPTESDGSSNETWSTFSISSMIREEKEERKLMDDEKKEEEDFLVEEKEDAFSALTSDTTQTICQICMDIVHAHESNVNPCCGKAFHASCNNSYMQSISMNRPGGFYTCPNCRREGPVVMIFNKTLHFYQLTFFF